MVTTGDALGRASTSSCTGPRTFCSCLPQPRGFSVRGAPGPFLCYHPNVSKPLPPNWKETCRKGLKPPYGWRYSPEAGGLVEIRSEQVVRTIILKKRLKGETMRKISDFLNDKGFRPPEGSSDWYHSHVQKILVVKRRRTARKWQTTRAATVASKRFGGDIAHPGGDRST